MDRRALQTIEQLEGQREHLRHLEKVVAPTVLGIAAFLRGEGLSEHAQALEDFARKSALTCGQTRALVEQLSTLFDHRLEDTNPFFGKPGR